MNIKVKKCFLNSCLSVLSLIVIGGNCKNKRNIQAEEKGFHTAPDYRHPHYTPEAFKEMLVPKSPKAITSFRKKLETRQAKWLANGSVKEPYEIWSAYRSEVLQKLEAQGLEALTNYYNSWGSLIKEPTEANEEQMIEAAKKLRADIQAQQALEKFARDTYNSLENTRLTEPILSYFDYFYFILSKSEYKLHHTIKKIHFNLKEWKKDKRPSGLQLWSSIKKAHAKRIKASPTLQYKENLSSIEESLKRVDQLADNPYSLTCKDMQETLPNGLKKLDTFLNDEIQEVKDKDDIKSLNTYRKLIDIS
ncbi:hypothetical protein [Candidatus Cardinium hertigii]|uniref:Uncharacterized protein n=1 Tax=Candidatus Cardinium hertigii TaxID=247481 RepID=A0A3N2QBB4_9BACT|nr:hypothetical protein [Candidatus Cardinium hertigii]ROT47097.1 hypothetical protein EDM02_04380 [Candidatus Cardinium hertigii]